MPERPIQRQFGKELIRAFADFANADLIGDKVMEAFADFARSDLKSPDALEQDEFSHVSNAALRRSLAQVLYGVRWIYKLGLALLVRDEERAAHVRAQIVDYASVAEALLSYSIAHAIRKGYVAGESYKWQDPDEKRRSIDWARAQPEYTLRRRSFWWFIRVAREFSIVDNHLSEDLDWLRQKRNTVHLAQRAAIGHAAFLSQSKRAFSIATRTIRQTKNWKAKHP